MMIEQEVLKQFCGDLARYRHWTRRLIYTPGVQYVAENGGQHGAYWLIDAIASYQGDKRIEQSERLRAFQMWILVVNPAEYSAVLRMCDGDSPKPIIEQTIEYTDFDLPAISFYVCEGDGERVLMLTSEY